MKRLKKKNILDKKNKSYRKVSRRKCNNLKKKGKTHKVSLNSYKKRKSHRKVSINRAGAQARDTKLTFPRCETLLDQCIQHSKDCFFQASISVLYRGKDLLSGLGKRMDSVLKCATAINEMQCSAEKLPVIKLGTEICMDLSGLSKDNRSIFEEIHSLYLDALAAKGRSKVKILVITDIKDNGEVVTGRRTRHADPKFMKSSPSKDKFVLNEGGVPHIFLEACFLFAFYNDFRTPVNPEISGTSLLSIPYINYGVVNKLGYLINNPSYPSYPLVICGCCFLDGFESNICELPGLLHPIIQGPAAIPPASEAVAEPEAGEEEGTPGYLLIGGCVLLVRGKVKHTMSYNLCNQTDNYILCDSRWPSCINLNTDEIKERYESPRSGALNVAAISFVFRRIL